MPRTLKTKELVNSRLAANYGGWMYCDICNENIGYLCYSTYDRIELSYCCNCGNEGKILIDFEDSKADKECKEDLIVIKNRLCCPKDDEPLITLLEGKLAGYDLKISCKSCASVYQKKK